MTLRLACIGALLLCTALSAPAAADELVVVAPHRATNLRADADRMPPLLGYLARPLRSGRVPAVVLLHGCSGFGAHEVDAARQLARWGYVGLALDSLGSANTCEGNPATAPELADAFAALDYLAAQDFADPTHIAIMGYSMGATAALQAVEKGLVQQLHQHQFTAAIAYYPVCSTSSGIMVAATLIVIGDADDWTPADTCRTLAAHTSDLGTTRQPGTGAPLDLVEYPNATHAFDRDDLPLRYLGHALRHDPAATADAADRVHAFLRRYLGGE